MITSSVLRAAGFVDARDFGCRADYETISCTITADGKVTRKAGSQPVPFQPADAGKILIIGAAATWTNYALDPVPLNAQITAVDGAGVATVVSVDGTARGTIQANTNTTAEFFTDNTDAISQALDYQRANGLSHVQLPEGTFGLCPFVSQTWQGRAYFDNAIKSKPVFVMKDGMLLKGAGRSKTRIKIGYFGEFEPFKNPYVAFRYSPIVFLFEPVESQKTVCGLESFSLEFPFCPAVQSGYTLIADGWNTSPARHAIHGTLRDMAVVNPPRNTSLMYSINGGIYDANNNVVEESRYVFDNCEFETAGLSIKNQNSLTGQQQGGKSVYVTNVVFHGGGNVITRHYLDSGAFTQQGADYFLQMNQTGFSWGNFNAHSDYPSSCFEPKCRLRKAWKGTIQSVTSGGNGTVTFAMQSGNTAPATKADATLLIQFGSTNRQVYLEGAASIVSGSQSFSANMTQAYLSPAEIAALAGAPVRVYYEENTVKAVYDIVNPGRIRLDPATAAGQSLLGQTNLDVTVNYSDASDGMRGAFGHTFYAGYNVNFYISGMTITDCAKRSFRVSSGGSSARYGVHELTDYTVIPARGMPAFCNNGTVFQAAEEFSGPLKMRRSSASSVYCVILDMDSNSTFLAQGGISGPSTIKNSTVSGSLAGDVFGGQYGIGRSTSIIENSSVNLTLIRYDGNSGVMDEGVPHVVLKNCINSAIVFQNGSVTATDSQLSASFSGTLAQYDLWKGAIKGAYTNCDFTTYFTGIWDPTAAQRADFGARQTTVYSGVNPDAFASMRTYMGIFSAGNKFYANVLANLGTPFQMGVLNACGVRPHHRYLLSTVPKTALFIDSRCNQFRFDAASLDDVLVNCYHHNEWDDSLMAAQLDLNGTTEITIIPQTDGFVLRPTGKIKPASLRPRNAGERIVLWWNPDKFCWFEKPMTNQAASAPTWNGMNGEFVANSNPNGTNGWRCVYDLGESVTQDLPNQYQTVNLFGNPRVYLGYEAVAWQDPGTNFQFSADGGLTWGNPFPDSISKAYAQSGIVRCDWVSGKATIWVGQPIRVKYRSVTAIRWVPILGAIGDAGKFAWSENAGWQNWKPAYGGFTVNRGAGQGGYLAGYVWAENIGWIKLGSDSGGPYRNTSADDWGVNLAASGGALSGYAWSETSGWINFNTSHERAAIAWDGRFDGYAWSESIGWIHFRNAWPAYLVSTTNTLPPGAMILIL